jgi:hypothetical protein
MFQEIHALLVSLDTLIKPTGLMSVDGNTVIHHESADVVMAEIFFNLEDQLEKVLIANGKLDTVKLELFNASCISTLKYRFVLIESLSVLAKD